MLQGETEVMRSDASEGQVKTFQYFSNKERYSAVQTYSSGSPVFLYEIFGQYLEFLKQRKVGERFSARGWTCDRQEEWEGKENYKIVFTNTTPHPCPP